MTTNAGPGFENGGDPNAPNPTIKTLDLDEGRGWKGSVTGGSVVVKSPTPGHSRIASA